MLGIQLVIGLVLFGIAALGARLAYFDNVPQQPRFLYHGLTRRRRGLIVEYPPGVARLAGIALLLYALGLALISINILNVIAGSNPPAWSSFGGWPLLIGVLLSIYVMLRLRRTPPPADTGPAPDVEKQSLDIDAAPEVEKQD
ncbi:MAG: hypothetical protein M3Z98_03055 [Candidatus Dormibacteraeota bacterium]|nr:hypothetical protein [Candidatus Dormibacteraeota bacterium]